MASGERAATITVTVAESDCVISRIVRELVGHMALNTNRLMEGLAADDGDTAPSGVHSQLQPGWQRQVLNVLVHLSICHHNSCVYQYLLVCVCVLTC